MSIIDIQTFVSADELFALFGQIDLEDEELEPELELTDGFIRIAFPGIVAIELGTTEGEDFLRFDSLLVTGPEGQPLVSAPDIGLVLNDDGTTNLDSFTGWALALSDEDDLVDADEALGGFGEILGALPIGGAGGEEDLLSGGVIDFGGGADTLVYALPRADITTAIGEDGAISVISPAGVSTLVDLEEIRLSDGSFLFGLSDDAGLVYRLYAASLARTPDAGGLRFWDGQSEAGRTPRELAQAFVQSDEFAEKFLGDGSDEAFIDALFQNVLGREADEGGRSFWLDQFSSGAQTRATMLIAFSESAENVEMTAADIEDGFWVV